MHRRSDRSRTCMFAPPRSRISTKHRASRRALALEVVATLGLLLVIFALARSGRSPVRTGGRRRLHRRGVLLHQLDQLRQPGHHRRPDVLRQLRRNRPVVGSKLHLGPARRRPRRVRPHPDALSRDHQGQAADIIAPHLRERIRPRDPLSRTSTEPSSPERNLAMHLVAIGGSDAGISAALRARELDPTAEVTVVVADAYPNFSICGIPYYVSGEVRTGATWPTAPLADLAATGNAACGSTPGRPAIDVAERILDVVDATGATRNCSYDAAGRGHRRAPCPAAHRGAQWAPTRSAPTDGVHLLHSMGDTFALMRTLEALNPASAVIVGAGYIGLEMAEALSARGLRVTQIEQLPEVLPTVDPEPRRAGARRTATPRRRRCAPTPPSGASHSRRRATPAALQVDAASVSGATRHRPRRHGPRRRRRSARHRTRRRRRGRARRQRGDRVDRGMRTNLPDVFAAGDCVITHHRLLGITYLPLGTTAHKQGRVAGENALGGEPRVRGQPGHPGREGLRPGRARTGLREHEALAGGLRPRHQPIEADDHKAYYPGSHRIHDALTGDRAPGGSSASSSSATATPKSPSASTSPPPPSSTK